jgi:hypothetical protein
LRPQSKTAPAFLIADKGVDIIARGSRSFAESRSNSVKMCVSD